MGIGTMRNFISTALLATAATACAGSPLSDPKPEPVPLYAGPWAGAGVDMEAVSEPNPSLWATSPNALLSMRRAKAVGDLLTVVVEMNDQANLKSSLSRSQGSSEDLGIDALSCFGVVHFPPADNQLWWPRVCCLLFVAQCGVRQGSHA